MDKVEYSLIYDLKAEVIVGRQVNQQLQEKVKQLEAELKKYKDVEEASKDED